MSIQCRTDPEEPSITVSIDPRSLHIQSGRNEKLGGHCTKGNTATRVEGGHGSRRVEEPGSRRQCYAAFDYRQFHLTHGLCRRQILCNSISYDARTMTFVSYVKRKRFPLCNNPIPLEGSARVRVSQL